MAIECRLRPIKQKKLTIPQVETPEGGLWLLGREGLTPLPCVSAVEGVGL
ncbi:MAG: hypothetical protein SCH66_14875 [Methanolobus sp.]|nr:hypothetical protein [Methanolobus sp.]